MSHQIAREALGEFAAYWTGALMKHFWARLEEASRWEALKYELDLQAMGGGQDRCLWFQDFPRSLLLRVPCRPWAGMLWGITDQERKDFVDEWLLYSMQEGRCRAEAATLLCEIRTYWVPCSRRNSEAYGDFNGHAILADEDPDFFGWFMNRMSPYSRYSQFHEPHRIGPWWPNRWANSIQ